MPVRVPPALIVTGKLPNVEAEPASALSVTPTVPPLLMVSPLLV